MIKRVEIAEIKQTTRNAATSTTGTLSTPATAPSTTPALPPASDTPRPLVPPQSTKGSGTTETDTSDTTRKTAKLRTTLDRSLTNNVAVLEKVLDKVPAAAKTAIQNAIDTSNIKREQNTVQPNTFNNLPPPPPKFDSDKDNDIQPVNNTNSNTVRPIIPKTTIPTAPGATKGITGNK